MNSSSFPLCWLKINTLWEGRGGGAVWEETQTHQTHAKRALKKNKVELLNDCPFMWNILWINVDYVSQLFSFIANHLWAGASYALKSHCPIILNGNNRQFLSKTNFFWPLQILTNLNLKSEMGDDLSRALVENMQSDYILVCISNVCVVNGVKKNWKF